MNFYQEQRKMFNEIEKILKSGTELNLNCMILQLTQKYAVSEKSIVNRLKRYEKAEMVEIEGDLIKWIV